MKMPLRLKPFIVILAVLFVTFIAGSLRWRAVNMLPVDYDEDDYLLAAQQYASLIHSGDLKGFLETNYRTEHPPLAKILFGISILPLPNEPLIPDQSSDANPNSAVPKDLLHNARLTSAIFGTLESLLLAVINPLAGLFLAVHTFTIKYTSQVMLEALPAFTSLAVVYCYLQYKHRRDKLNNTNGKNGWLVASAVFLGFTAGSKYLYCVVGLAVLVDWMIVARKDVGFKRSISKIVVWGLIALFVFFICDPYLWPAPIDRLKESILFHASYAQSAHVQQTGWPFWQPLVWLAQSCPWHPGVFVVAIDLLISILAIVGINRLWARDQVYGLWLGIAVFFLLIWPTKWPQYILILTAPLSIAAAEGVKALLFEPLASTWKRVRGKKRWSSFSLRELLRGAPWLLPGMLTLSVLILYPLLYQAAMSLTDFSGPSIKDGIQGGVWRAASQGLLGQAEALDPSSNQFGSSLTVHYTGPNVIKAVFSNSPDLIVFELLWTVLSVGFQAFLGISIALLLNQRGVRFPNVWRTIFLLPWAIPEFVGALVWLRTFDPTVGWVSQAFGTSGGSGGAVFFSKLLNAGGPNLSLFLMLIAATWIGFPFVMLAASASLKLIPDEVYDASAIDGAAGWSLFRFVTWPLLLPLVVPVIIIRAIFAFNQFYLFYVFFPRPQFSGFGTFAYYSYLYFKEGGLYSVSAAINMVTILVLVILLILFNRWSKAAEGVTYA
jgi:ABC-type sugar transport system permease subunit